MKNIFFENEMIYFAPVNQKVVYISWQIVYLKGPEYKH